MTTASIKLTKTERAVLDALWASASKALPYHQIGAGLTPRGRRVVHNRMEDRRLIARSELNSGDWTITYRGMQALGVMEGGLRGASEGTSLPGSTPVPSASPAQINIGDRITFRSATSWSDKTVTRVVNGFSAGRPTVRFGWPEFIVRPEEILSVKPA